SRRIRDQRLGAARVLDRMQNERRRWFLFAARCSRPGRTRRRRPLMAILIDETKRVLVQGITGREGRARTRLMRDYGTNVVAGVTPGKGGENVLGVPVFNTPQDAIRSLGKIDISVLFVPAAGVKEAAISAIEAGIKLTVLVPDRVPVWDAMEIAAAAKAHGAIFVGPNTLGILSPGKAVVGMIGGREESARQWFKHGIPKG